MDIEKALKNTIKSGKVYLGSNRTIKAIEQKKAKLVIIASNCPEEFEENLKKSKVHLYKYKGTNHELGTVCGKPFPVSTLAVIDDGKSGILALGEMK